MKSELAQLSLALLVFAGSAEARSETGEGRTTLSSNLKPGKAGTSRGRVELSGAGLSTTLELEVRTRAGFSGIVARRLTAECRSHAVAQCGVVLARLSDEVVLFYGNPARRKGTRLHLTQSTTATGGVALTAAASEFAAGDPKLQATADKSRFEAAGLVGGKRLVLQGPARAKGDALTAQQLAVLALSELVARAVEAVPASASQGWTVRSHSADTTETVPPLDDSILDCIDGTGPGCPPTGGGPDRSCWVCDLCGDTPGGQTLGGCLGIPPGLGWGGGGGPVIEPEPARPDLVMGRIQQPSAKPFPAGSSIGLSVAINNRGDGDAGQFTVEFFLNKLPAGTRVELNDSSKTVSGLKSQKSATVTKTAIIKSGTTVGTYELCAKADPPTGEVFTSNNSACGETITVK